MTHILAATDLSPRADHAVARAFRLAGETGGDLTVVTITDDAMPDRLAKILLPETEAHLAELCQGLSDGSRIRFATRVEKGDPSHAIQAIANELGAELVVLGPHRRRGVLDGFRETTLERVVRLTSQPVLLVREPAERRYASVLAAVDFSPAATAAIWAATRLAPDAAIHGFHAVGLADTSYSEADPRARAGQGILADAETARTRWIETTTLPLGLAPPKIVPGELPAVLEEERARLAPDLIALGAHARLSLSHPMLGSFARTLVADPPTDLLVAKPRN